MTQMRPAAFAQLVLLVPDVADRLHLAGPRHQQGGMAALPEGPSRAKGIPANGRRE